MRRQRQPNDPETHSCTCHCRPESENPPTVRTVAAAYHHRIVGVTTFLNQIPDSPKSPRHFLALKMRLQAPADISAKRMVSQM